MARSATAPGKKAGGTGKKGKVFMEDRSQILSMMNDIADSKSAAMQAKIDKARGPDAPTSASGEGKAGSGKVVKGGAAAGAGGKKVQTSGDKKRLEKAKALDDAKKAIMEREKEKRDRKRARKAGTDGSVKVEAGAVPGKEVKAKKRVGFA